MRSAFSHWWACCSCCCRILALAQSAIAGLVKESEPALCFLA